MPSEPSINSADCEEDSPDLSRTMKSVNWEFLLHRACRIFDCQTAEWGTMESGAYNVVRFLHLHDTNSNVVVVRVPYTPQDGWSAVKSGDDVERKEALLSEVATMLFIKEKTTIPIPQVFDYEVSAEGHNAITPYIIMSKIEGTPLVRSWDHMADADRRFVLEQVANILVELSTHRLPQIGLLFPNDTGSSDRSWVVRGDLKKSSGDSVPQRAPPLSSALEAQITDLSAAMEEILEHPFSHSMVRERYIHLWFIRSLMPSLIDTSLDKTGFPICPGDFHSQNIMIKNDANGPTITGVIDWDLSQTRGTSFFARLPLFIVDHPMWSEDDPLRQRNVGDQNTFLELVKAAEFRQLPGNNGQLYRAYRGSHGLYLCEQIFQIGEMMERILWPQLLDWVEGDGEDDEDSSDDETDDTESTNEADGVSQTREGGVDASHDIVKSSNSSGVVSDESANHPESKSHTKDEIPSATQKYIDRLTSRGLLKAQADRLYGDLRTFWDAQDVLGDMLERDMSRREFLIVLQRNRDRLLGVESITDWLQANEVVCDS